MKCAHPIGIFDSGIGGLPIAQKIHELLPNEHLIYVADTAHTPYGEKTEDYILQRSLAVTDFLFSHNAKAIVVACNTATMISIQTLRQLYSIPFIGVEPGVKPAAIYTQSGIIGVLATEKTLTSEAFNQLTQRVAANAQLAIQPCPKLVRLVENLQLDDDETHQTVHDYIQPLIAQGADTLILGCTHFTHLAPVIEQVAGLGVSVIRTETPVANEVVRRLQTAGHLNPSTTRPATPITFYTNSDLNTFQKQIAHLWGENAHVKGF